MNWWNYVERVARTSRQRDIAERTGIDATNVSRWKTGQVPKPGFVAQFARAYQRPVLEAFVAAGFLTADEAKERPAAVPSLSSLSDDQLVEEIRRRMRAGDGDVARDATPMKVAARRVGRAPSGQQQDRTDEEQAAQLGLDVVRPAYDAEGPEDENPGNGVTTADDAG